MLSRTAESLFWLGRYMERADNVARLIEAGRRFDAMSGRSGKAGDPDRSENDWGAILIAAGCRSTFDGDLTEATPAEAIRHLLIDSENPSSIRSCYSFARANARAQRGSVSAETWGAANDAWRAALALSDVDCDPRFVAGTLERMRKFSALFRGAVGSTMLDDERLRFMLIGQYLERADATARLVDVKYHVLLPDADRVGSAMDQLQWNTLLRAAGSRSAYRWVYHKPVEYRLVIDLLLLHAASPRSYRFCLDRLHELLCSLHEGSEASGESLNDIKELRDRLIQIDVEDIIQRGLHEYLTELIYHCNRLALTISGDFGFGPAPNTQAQEQSQ